MRQREGERRIQQRKRIKPKKPAFVCVERGGKRGSRREECVCVYVDVEFFLSSLIES